MHECRTEAHYFCKTASRIGPIPFLQNGMEHNFFFTYAVKYLSGEVLGNLCHECGPEIYRELEPVLLGGIKDNLERDQDLVIEHPQLVEKLSARQLPDVTENERVHLSFIYTYTCVVRVQCLLCTCTCIMFSLFMYMYTITVLLC